jgi:hypothetical protein
MSAAAVTAESRIARRKDGALKHVAHCAMAFGRYDAEHCARCGELAQGAESRSNPGYGRRARVDAQRRAEIARHDCRAMRCGPVCTAFDW